jgi:HSP20 family protein
MAKHSDKVEVKKIQDEPTRVPSVFGGSHPLQTLHEEIDRLFDGFFRTGPGEGGLDRIREDWPGFGFVSGGRVPSVDVSEDDKAYEIAVELPGLDEKDVELILSGDRLSLSGEKKSEQEEKKKDWYRSERRYGSFKRSFRVPDDVDAGKIKAAMEKGVMTVTLPKSATGKKKERGIKVTAA